MLVLALFLLRQKDSPVISAALTAVRPAVVGLLIWTAYDLGSKVLLAGGITWGEAIAASWDKILIVAVVAIGVIRFNVNPALVMVAAAVFGVLVYR